MNGIVMLSEAGQPVTTSLAIAEGVRNTHKSVLQTIRYNIADFNEFGLVAFEMRARPLGKHGGGDVEYAVLNEQHATLLLTFMRNIGIVKEFKKRLVKAFFEMRDELARRERAPSVEALSRMEILQLAIQSEQDRLRLEQEKAALEARLNKEAPMIAFARQVEIIDGEISVAQAAKILGTGQRRLFAFLRRIGWVTRRNEPYQAKIEDGCLDVKIGKWMSQTDGLQESMTTLVTGKGLTRLQQLWAQRDEVTAA